MASGFPIASPGARRVIDASSLSCCNCDLCSSAFIITLLPTDKVALLHVYHFSLVFCCSYRLPNLAHVTHNRSLHPTFPRSHFSVLSLVLQNALFTMSSPNNPMPSQNLSPDPRAPFRLALRKEAYRPD